MGWKHTCGHVACSRDARSCTQLGKTAWKQISLSSVRCCAPGARPTWWKLSMNIRELQLKTWRRASAWRCLGTCGRPRRLAWNVSGIPHLLCWEARQGQEGSRNKGLDLTPIMAACKGPGMSPLPCRGETSEWRIRGCMASCYTSEETPWGIMGSFCWRSVVATMEQWLVTHFCPSASNSDARKRPKNICLFLPNPQNNPPGIPVQQPREPWPLGHSPLLSGYFSCWRVCFGLELSQDAFLTCASQSLAAQVAVFFLWLMQPFPFAGSWDTASF